MHVYILLVPGVYDTWYVLYHLSRRGHLYRLPFIFVHVYDVLVPRTGKNTAVMRLVL